MPILRCLSCAKQFVIDPFTYWNYDGQVCCPECKTLLYIKLEQGELRSMKIEEHASPLTKEGEG